MVHQVAMCIHSIVSISRFVGGWGGVLVKPESCIFGYPHGKVWYGRPVAGK